mmetsp:Transcript_6599/g.9593  ORF Transcript_6599/g.9593 Transcript_6599/m.9593 type:complete len:222 (-) Transcript_6599:206-871(-)
MTGRERPDYDYVDDDDDYMEEQPATKKFKGNDDDDAYVFEEEESDEAYVPEPEIVKPKRGRGRPSKKETTQVINTLEEKKVTNNNNKKIIIEYTKEKVKNTLNELKEDIEPGVPAKTMYWFKSTDYIKKQKAIKKPVGTSRALRTMLNNEKDCAYVSAEATVSMLPKQKYCDITGLHGRYTDPLSQLRYHSLPVYSILSRFKKENIRTEYLELRKASNKIK